MSQVRAARAILGVALPVVMSACGKGPVQVAAQPRVASETTVEVDNQSMSDIRVYVLNGGTQYRLGLANSNSVTTLRLPGALRHLTGPLQLVARPMAGNSFLLPPVVIALGQRVALTLRNHLALSDVAVSEP